MLGKNFKTNLLNIDLIFEKSKIKDGDHVGDLGCGRGGHFAFMSSKKVGKKGLVYAVDIIKANLNLVEKEAKELNLANLKPVWSDIEVFGATKVPPESLNIAFLVNVLHESQKPLEIVREATRLLKKNGRLVIVDWKKTASPLGPDKDTCLDKEILVQGGRRLGLLIEEEFEAGHYHFGLIFTKP